MKNKQEIEKLRHSLLAWYDQSGRTLPWRVRPEERARGVVPDPYAVWLSEIMLQQTTIAHATPYWQRFLREFPTVNDLANADRDEILSLWAGLGYYARARNLHKCAQTVRDDYGGRFPDCERELLKLPGIGPYTAATIAAICFSEPTNIVDGNVERVISRMFRLQIRLPKAKRDIRELAAPLADPVRPGDYGQALMDLGATICLPRNPLCHICPWSTECAGLAFGDANQYPKKAKKNKTPKRHGSIFVLICEDKLLLERRDDEGLLGGMMGFPGSGWEMKSDPSRKPTTPISSALTKVTWRGLPEPVRHVFTHFELSLTVYVAYIKPGMMPRFVTPKTMWVSIDALGDMALPSLMRKVWVSVSFKGDD